MIRVPAWKRWLSHFFEIHLESAPSDVNPHLYVSLKRGRYQLSTAHAVYSYDDLYHNFAGLFERMRLDRLPGDEVLVLGFGLGSVPYLLEQVHGIQLSYTGVELDESVIQLASAYTLPRLDSPVQLIAADAAAFVQRNERRFDLIVVDVFLDDKIPEAIQQAGFFSRVKEGLKPGGMVIMNTLAATEQDQKKSAQLFENVFRPVFPEAVAIPVPGNLMLINDPAFLQ